jgi:single-stranded-DNA-specific exonuclease
MIFGNIEPFETYVSEKYSKNDLEDLYQGKPNSINLDMIYYPSINEYNGYENIQIIVQNYR